MESFEEITMQNSFSNGGIVSVPCEIRPGMASSEREVKVKVHDGFIRAFVTYESVEDPKPSSHERREGRVRAVIVSFSKEDIRLLFAGQDVDPSNPAPISPEWLAENAKRESTIHP